MTSCPGRLPGWISSPGGWARGNHPGRELSPGEGTAEVGQILGKTLVCYIVTILILVSLLINSPFPVDRGRTNIKQYPDSRRDRSRSKENILKSSSNRDYAETEERKPKKSFGKEFVNFYAEKLK